MLEVLEKVNHPQNEHSEFYIIWLHGLGADCHDFVPLVPELKLTKKVKFIFPNAPQIPITLNNGYVMRAWYDIKTLDRLNDGVDHQGIENTVQKINHLIDSLVKSGVQSEKVFLAGFSQGGVISYTTGLKTPHKLGGILALSCYLPNGGVIAKSDPINKSTPILAIHGKNDHVVPYEIGKQAYTELKSGGYNISWKEYAMEHNVCQEEINEIHKWFENIFNHK